MLLVFITGAYTHFAGEKVAQFRSRGRHIKEQMSILKEQTSEIRKQVNAARESAHAAQRSVAINQETFISTKRPWIQVINVELPPRGVTFTPNGICINVRFRLQNGGTTPAIDVKYSLETIAIKPTQYDKIGEILRNACNRFKRTTLGFNAQAKVTGFIFPNEISREMDIADGTPYVWFQQHDHTTSDDINWILIVINVAYRFTFAPTIHINGIPYIIRRKNNAMISPPRPGDVLLQKWGRLRPRHNLIFEAAVFGYADRKQNKDNKCN